jgi:uncharacterized membrane protein YdbT with pleckstrin-like domain
VAFPTKHLNEGEDIVLDLHPHWWFFAPQILALFLSLALGVLLLAVGAPSWATAPVGVLVLVALGFFGVRYARWSTTNFVVTTDRLIYRHGVLAKQGIEIPLERVNTVFFRQSIFERILRCGDLEIESASEDGSQAFTNVRRPADVQKEIYVQMEDNENRKFDRIRTAPGGGGGGGTGSGDSIPQQIRELDELRRQGVLSEDEFNKKKKDLLERM